MIRWKRSEEFPLLRSEEARLKREKREKLKNYILIWAAILVPVGLIWYAYVHSEWVAEFIGSNWRIARFQITFSLTAIILLVWGATRLFRKR